MQIVLFAETKFSKEIVVTAGQKLKDSATYLALYPIQLSGTVAYLLFLQFLAQCCLLVGFCQRICLFVLSFFSRIHFASRKFETNNSKMRSWISLPSQFPFLLLFVFFNKFYFCLGHHPPTHCHPC